jgi:uncharacterized protein YkwD
MRLFGELWRQLQWKTHGVRIAAWMITLVVIGLFIVPHLVAAGGKNTGLKTPQDQSSFNASAGAIVLTTTPGDVATNDDFVARVIQRTNMYRAQFGCPALKSNALLQQAAYGHSADMGQHNLMSHIGSNGSTPEQRITATGYRYSNWAENVAVTQPTPEAAVDAWFNEKPPNDGHRLNILNCTLLDIGVGYYYSATSSYHYFWTQDFGRAAGT